MSNEELSTLGKYHILERLAISGLAEIYRVKTVGIAGFEKVQVLNRIRRRYSSDQRFLRAFISEAKIAFSLNHRNIVQVFEFGKVDDELFLATEYIPGVNLALILELTEKAQRVMPIGLACYLMSEVAAGLDYAHRKADRRGTPLDLVHGDITPHNVGCSWEGSVKILDFGISRAAAIAAAPQDRHRGIPRYVAPERIRGGTLTPQGDIFSFGAILWQLCSGAPLFAATDRETLEEQINSQEIVSPCSLNPEVVPDLEELVMRCLERDPRRRLDTANQLQLQLHRIQRDVGAVIGSRSLATFLGELFAGHGGARDVRQDDHSVEAEEAGETPPPALQRTQPALDLIEAASELAQPPNPPAETVPSSALSSTKPDTRRIRRATAMAPTEPAPAPGPQPRRRASEEARVAGVLRSSRRADDDIAVPRRPTDPSIRRAAPEHSTPRVTPARAADPHRDLESRPGPRGDEQRTPVVTDPQELQLLEEESVDETIDGLDDQTADDVMPPGPAAHPGSTADPATSTGATPPTPIADYSDELARSAVEAVRQQPALGEKKRFIAAAILLEGPAEQRREALSILADIAYKLDGSVHHSDEHQLVALFGLPLADENDIIAAVQFAQDAQDAVGHLMPSDEGSDSWEGEHRVTLRAGLRAGTARMRGPAGRRDYQVTTTAIADSIALGEQAAEGQLYVAGAAARLAAMHYALREVELLRRHGKPIRCYRVLGPLRKQRRHGGMHEPLIGRDIELRAIRSAWREAALAGEQRAVLIGGDAGVGKSRLVDEFLLRHCGDARVIAVGASPHRRDTANALLLDLLRSATGVWHTSSARGRARLFERLAALLGLDEAQHDHEDLLAALRAVVEPTAPELEADAYQRRPVYQALRRLLNRIAEPRPLVVVLEDLHWADSASLEQVRLLVEQPGDASATLLIVLTARQTGTMSSALQFASERLSRVTLRELDEGDRQQLIMEVLGDSAQPDLQSEIERRAGGNPFYIQELGRAVGELNVAAFSDIPATVQGAVASRVDRLPSSVKSALQHAAVIGPRVREGILTRVLARNPARALAELRDRGFLLASVSMSMAQGTTASEEFEREWAFRHVLVQEVIYESISSGDRRELHRRVGEILARRARRGTSDPPAEVARHLELGGLTEEAGIHYLRAAEAASAGYANREALALFDRSVALNAQHPQRLYAAHAGREHIYGRLGLHDKQKADQEVLRELCGDAPAQLADLRVREAVRLLRVGEFYRALERAEQAEHSATAAGDELLRGEALRLRGEAYERLNDQERAVGVIEQALEIFERRGSVTHQVRARLSLGRAMLAQASYDKALSHYEPALALIKRTGDRWHQRVLRNNLAVVNVCRGDFSRALDDALSSLKLCIEFGDRAREGDNASVVGIIHVELGMYELARRYLDSALAIHRETGSRWSEADTLTYCALLETCVGNYPRAIALLRDAKAIAERIGAKYIAVNAANAHALMLCERNQAGDAAKAVDEATRAFETARDAALIVGEIPGLSRAARATALLGNAEAARALSRRAVELLETQRIIESAEEEIYFTHYMILAALEAPAAADYLRRAYDGFRAKYERIDNVEFKRAFAERVPLNIAIQQDYAAYRQQS